MKAPNKCSLTYFTTQNFSIKFFPHFATNKQTKQTIVSEGQGRLKKGKSTNDYARLPWEEGVKLGLKSDYVICERSLTVLLTGLKFMNQSLFSPCRLDSLFVKIEILP